MIPCFRFVVPCLIGCGLLLSNIFVVSAQSTGVEQPGEFRLQLRSQQESVAGNGRFHPVERDVRWSASQTAIIVCDVWDSHTCRRAVERVNEFAPRLEEVLQQARAAGSTIIHAPSGCMDYYAAHPARLRAQQARSEGALPEGITSWCYSIPTEERGVYPVDQSDGGNDDSPEVRVSWRETLIAEGRNPGRPWRKQNDLITIDAERDLISDRGEEIWQALQARGIKNVMLAGVHVNMCVLGRPFGLRQMAQNGMNTVLLSDLTDAMYNPQRWPYVNHFTGNDLVISHIERYVCPTITSDQIVGGKPFRYREDTRPHVVIVIAEDPYDTHLTLPQFAVRRLGKDFRVTILHASQRDRHEIPGLAAVESADLLLLSVRRRALSEKDLQVVQAYLAAGKPLVALRTSNHAFALRGESAPAGHAEWPEFDAEILGGNYQGSYPDELRSSVRAAAAAADTPLLRGLSGLPFVQGGHMYKTGPLKPGATVLLEGDVDGFPSEPVAWTFRRSDGGTSYYVALGHPEDFTQPAFTALLTNMVSAATEQPVPVENMSAASEPVAPRDWLMVPLPQREQISRAFGDEDSSLATWLRCVVQLPDEWKHEPCLILDWSSSTPPCEPEIFWNNVPLECDRTGCVQIPRDAYTADSNHLLVVRLPPGMQFPNAAPVLRWRTGKQTLLLAGWWQFRRGNEPELAAIPLPVQFFGFHEITFSPRQPLWQARSLTRPGEFTDGIEGPACDADGNVFAVNYGRQGTIGRVSPLGAGEVFLSLPEGSIGNGIRFTPTGEFFVADYTGHNIWKVNPVTRQATRHAHNPDMNQPNDLAIADDGTLFASDPNWSAGTGQLWRVDTDGTTHLLAENMGTTNGLDVSPDGKTLYVNESVQRNVWAFTITSKKTLVDKRLVKKFDDHGFDGMRCDVDGNLYITRYGKGTVVKMSPDGEILREIDVLGPRPSNLCFGGPDGCTVYVTEVEQTRLVSFRVDRPGREWAQLHPPQQSE